MTALLSVAAVVAWLLVFWLASRSERLMSSLCDFVLPGAALRGIGVTESWRRDPTKRNRWGAGA